MRIFLLCVSCLFAVIGIAAAIGYQPTRQSWGDDGVRSLTAIGLICLATSVVGAAPIGLVAPRWPAYIGQAVLAGTTIRLMLTVGIGYAYQQLARPHLSSYLLWACVFYLLLLVVETCFGVLAIRRHYVAPSQCEGTPA